MLETLWKKRLHYQLQTTSRQLRYIFNDHFSLVILFLIGLSSYGYEQWLTTSHLQPFKQWLLLSVSLVLTVMLLLGQFATFIQEADQFYLHHLEHEWKAYFKRAFIYSMILPSMIVLFSFAVVSPLLIKINGTVSMSLLALLLLLKAVQLVVRWYCFYQSSLQKINYIVPFVSFIIIALSFWSMAISFVLAIVCLIVAIYGVYTAQTLDWDTVMALEKKRRYRYNQFLKLFIDTNQDSVVVKKQGIFEKLYHKTNYATYYLYQRHFMRLAYYKELVIRLSVVFILLGLVINQVVILVCIALLCQFLLVLQLLPAYTHYQHYSMYMMLPISIQHKKAQFLKALHHVTLLQVVVMSVFLVIKLPIMEAICSIIVLFVVEKTILALYVRQKIGKIDG